MSVELELHVVAQVVEAELVVRAVGDVGAVGLAALLVGQVVHDDADGEAQEAVDLAHPLRVALGQVVVHGDDVNAAAGERIQVAGKRGDQRLAFAGLHLGDLAGVQHHAADQLHVEVAHADGAHAGLAHDREGLGQDLVERRLLGRADRVRRIRVGGVDLLGARLRDALAELGGLCAQLFVGERLESCGSSALICATVGSSALPRVRYWFQRPLRELLLNKIGVLRARLGANNPKY